MPEAIRIQVKDGNNYPEVDRSNPLPVLAGNANSIFRDGFVEATPDSDIWLEERINGAGIIVTKGGNAAGSSYMRISLSPYLSASEFKITSKNKFSVPYYLAVALSVSQRILGQEFFIGMVGVNEDDDSIELSNVVAPIAISGTVSITTNVATINTDNAHGLNGGDRVILYGNTENRLNVGPVVVTVVTDKQFTIPLTLANGTYTAGGNIKFIEPNNFVKNYLGFLLGDSVTATAAAMVSRRNGSKFKNAVITIPTTVAAQSNTSPYTDAFNAVGQLELQNKSTDALYIGRTPDGVAIPGSQNRFSLTVPDEEKEYRIQIRAKVLENISKIIAKITAIVKTGTTSAQVTTDVPHGLTAGQYVQIYGVRDITNFPNLTASTVVDSVIDANNFTITIAGAVTANSAGGVVVYNNGSVLLPGAINLNIQSIQRTNNILIVTMNTTATGLLPGEYCELAGMDGSGATYDGAYKVLRMTAATYELESVGADFGSITCGGSVIKRTDIRIHFITQIDATRLMVELAQANGVADGYRALASRILGGTVDTVTTVSTLTALTGGGVAHDAADTGNPVKIGGKSRTADPTPVADADRADLFLDLLGKIVNVPLAPRALMSQGNIVLTTTGETTLLAAAGAGIFQDISSIVISNTSATAVRVDIRDNTAGTVRLSVNVLAGDTVTIPFPDSPLLQNTVNWVWTAQLSAAVTDVRITAVGPKRKA